MLKAMSLTPILIGLFACAGLCALFALGQGLRARRHWRARRRFAASHRALWSLVFVLLALLGGLGGGALLGWRRLTDEALVARVETRQLGVQRYAVALITPDGVRREIELAGDDWQLDARVIKWNPTAVVLGAPPLYRLDRIGGRYRDAALERTAPRTVVALAATPAPLDLGISRGAFRTGCRGSTPTTAVRRICRWSMAGALR